MNVMRPIGLMLLALSLSHFRLNDSATRSISVLITQHANEKDVF